MKELSLDNIYRNRYQKYMLSNGKVYDSREVNWRLIEWDRVVGITTVINGKKYLAHCKHPDFKFFVIYRWGGQEWKEGKPVPVREWSVGWSDGKQAFMTDIDFKTGEKKREVVVPIETIQRHIHPRVEGKYKTVTVE